MGLAVSDGLGLTAQPIATVVRHGGLRDVEAVERAVKAHDVGVIVMGLPVNPDPRPRAEDAPRRRTHRLVETFAEKLREALGLPVELVDESFSTVEAQSVLREANLSRARRDEVVDRVAAAVILQRWLDARR
jgi:putative Holliday junction resolvase